MFRRTRKRGGDDARRDQQHPVLFLRVHTNNPKRLSSQPSSVQFRLSMPGHLSDHFHSVRANTRAFNALQTV
jgi:hypothetical protein